MAKVRRRTARKGCVPLAVATRRAKGGRRVLRKGFRWSKSRKACPVPARKVRRRRRR